MSSVIETIERAQLRRVPEFAPGDRLKVHFQVIEGNRRRVQVFEGVVIKRQGHGARETFTVRKQSFGVGVERMFPLHSPKIERIEVTARGDVRRAKLYYLRGRVGKKARVRERSYTGPEEAVEPGLLEEQGLQESVPADAAGEGGEAAGASSQSADRAAQERAVPLDLAEGDAGEAGVEPQATEAAEQEAQAPPEPQNGDAANADGQQDAAPETATAAAAEGKDADAEAAVEDDAASPDAGGSPPENAET